MSASQETLSNNPETLDDHNWKAGEDTGSRRKEAGCYTSYKTQVSPLAAKNYLTPKTDDSKVQRNCTQNANSTCCWETLLYTESLPADHPRRLSILQALLNAHQGALHKQYFLAPLRWPVPLGWIAGQTPGERHLMYFEVHMLFVANPVQKSEHLHRMTRKQVHASTFKTPCGYQCRFWGDINMPKFLGEFSSNSLLEETKHFSNFV